MKEWKVLLVHSFEDLKKHIGHEITCVGYDDAVVSLECQTCACVILTYNSPELVKRYG